MSEMKFDPMTGQPIADNAPGQNPGQGMNEQPAGGPMNGQPTGPAPFGQPMNGPMNGAPYGQPMNGPMNGQPISGAPYGQPMNGQPISGAPYGQPMNGPISGAPYGQPMNGPMNGQPMNGPFDPNMNQGVTIDPVTGLPVVGGEAPKKSKAPIIIAIIAGLILIAGVIAAVLLFNKKDDEAPVEEEVVEEVEPKEEEVVEEVEEELPEAKEEEEVVVEEVEEELPEAKEEEVVEEKEEKKVVSNVNVDPSSLFAFNIDGTDYQLPCKITDFLDQGFTFSDDSDGEIMLGSGDREYIYLLYQDDIHTNISVTVTNYSINAQELKDCHISDITLYANSLTDKGYNVTFHNGDLVLGEATYDELTAALGEPTSSNESSLSNTYRYETESEDSYSDNSVAFSFETEDDEKLDWVSIRVEDKPEIEEEEVSDKAPDYLSLYSAPKSLGSDLLSGNIDIEGTVYTLPVPLTEFTDNGWKISGLDETCGAGVSYVVTAEKGKKRLFLTTGNFDTNACLLKNTIVTSVSISSYAAPEFKLPIGLAMGQTKDEVDTVLKNNNIDFSYEKKYHQYEIKIGDNNDRITIGLDSEDETLDDIDLRIYGWLYE